MEREMTCDNCRPRACGRPSGRGRSEAALDPSRRTRVMIGFANKVVFLHRIRSNPAARAGQPATKSSTQSTRRRQETPHRPARQHRPNSATPRLANSSHDRCPGRARCGRRGQSGWKGSAHRQSRRHRAFWDAATSLPLGGAVAPPRPGHARRLRAATATTSSPAPAPATFSSGMCRLHRRKARSTNSAQRSS